MWNRKLSLKQIASQHPRNAGVSLTTYGGEKKKARQGKGHSQRPKVQRKGWPDRRVFPKCRGFRHKKKGIRGGRVEEKIGSKQGKDLKAKWRDTLEDAHWRKNKDLSRNRVKNKNGKGGNPSKGKGESRKTFYLGVPKRGQGRTGGKHH